MVAPTRQRGLNGLLVLAALVGGFGGAHAPAAAGDKPIWQPRYLASAEVPIPQRVAAADLVAWGKVQATEDKLVKAPYHADAKTNVTYRVVRFQVNEVLLGGWRPKEIRVGFLTRDSIPPGAALYESHSVERGPDYILCLKKHPTADFFVRCAPVQLFAGNQAAQLKAELERTRRLAGIMKDPAAALKAGNAADRYLAVTMLIHRYRTPHAVERKRSEKAINAEVSKLLLKELALADWKWDADRFLMYPPHPYVLFKRLGVTAQDGYVPRPTGDEQKKLAAAQSWVEANQQRYVVKRFDRPSK